MKKKSTVAVGSFAALALVLGLFAAAGAEEHPKEHPGKPAADQSAAKPGAGETALEGEIVDLSCYMGHGAEGKEHASCAKKCLTEGASAGLLKADGSVVLLLADHKKAKAFKLVKDLGGEKAKVTGMLSEKGGLKALVVSGAEKSK